MSDPIFDGWTERQWAKHDHEEGNLLAALKHYQAVHGDAKTLEICTAMLDFHTQLKVLRAEFAAKDAAEESR